LKFNNLLRVFFEEKTRRKTTKIQYLKSRCRSNVPTTMNNQSPLIPQGSLLDQRNKGRARVKIAVFLVLAIHGLGLMALLMQGCKKEPDATSAASSTEPTNNTPPPFVEPTNIPVAPTNLVAAPTNSIPAPQPVEPQPAPVAPAVNPTDYVIVKGDTFRTIATKFHVRVKALLEANPSVEPTKLKIGQAIHVPAPVTMGSGTSGNGTVGAADTSTNSGQSYTVKSGDSLTRIAGEFGITNKALRSANNLKTDKIVVGQKLKIPSKSSPPPVESTPSSAPTTPSTGQ
jgi:LysM repeat protein